MSYAIEIGEPVGDAIRRIAREQAERAIDEIDDSSIGIDETVHQIRKRLKKLRSLLRLFRGSIDDTFTRENRRFRDLGRSLAEVREATVVIDTAASLRDRYSRQLDDAGGRIIEDLSERREALDPTEAIDEARAALERAVDRCADWTVEKDGWAALQRGLKKTYKRARARFADAREDPEPEALHQWRKRAKYHRHAMKLLRRTWPAVINTRRRELARLTEVLGDHHDLRDLCELLASDEFGAPGDGAVVRGAALERSEALYQRALILGPRLFVEDSNRFARRLAAYFKAPPLR